MTQQQTYAGSSRGTYPFRSLAIFTLDLLVLYGLVAYGGRPTLT